MEAMILLPQAFTNAPPQGQISSNIDAAGEASPFSMQLRIALGNTEGNQDGNLNVNGQENSEDQNILDRLFATLLGPVGTELLSPEQREVISDLSDKVQSEQITAKTGTLQLLESILLPNGGEKTLSALGVEVVPQNVANAIQANQQDNNSISIAEQQRNAANTSTLQQSILTGLKTDTSVAETLGNAQILNQQINQSSEKTTAFSAGIANQGDQAAPVIEKWSANYQEVAKNPAQAVQTEEQTPTISAFRSSGESIDEFQITSQPGQKPVSTEGGQRQDATNQYIHSKLPGVQKEGNTSANGQFADSNTNQQAATPSENETVQLTTDTPKETPSFTLNSGLQEVQTSKPTIETTPVGMKLSNGQYIEDNEIIHQVAQRFSIQRKFESGSMSLRLHPQELGELKLDIQVEKEAIKAHIVAQNPHIQEILERNIPKLREALAGQGLSLEVMDVTVADNSMDNQSRFQEQTSWQQMGNFSRKPSGSATILDQDEEYTDAVASDQHLSVRA